MIDHQEMAGIIFNSQLATVEQINENVGEVTDTKDIGKVLVEKGILPEQTYNELIDFIESLHPENIVIEPDTPIEPVVESDGPEISELSFEEQLSGGEETQEIKQGLDALYTDTTESPVSEDEEFDHIHHDSLTIDLDDVPKHIETDGDLIISEDPFGSEEDLMSTNEPGRGDELKEIIQNTVSSDSILESNSILEDTVTPKPAPVEEPVAPVVIESQESVVPQPPAPKSSIPTPTPTTTPTTIPTTIPTTTPSQSPVVQAVTEEKKGDSLPPMEQESRTPEMLTIPIPEQITPQNTLNEILLFARNNSISDVHIMPFAPITARRYTKLISVGEEKINPERIKALLLETLPEKRMAEFRKDGDVEFVYTIKGGGRYRVTIMKLRNGWSFTARVVSLEIPSFEAIGLPDASLSLTKWAQGLVLVTGPAGCGKTTSLAALVENINQDRNENIITIEDPIETLFPMGKSHISQRQLGQHTLTQENALKGALRQDPDILLVSELRDMNSIELAVSAAETGHLVFGTMNTTNAIRTINRLIESFPADEQDVIRSMVSESLRGVICQQLIPRKDGNGVVAAFEVLLVTPAVGNMIRKNEMHQLNSAMVTGRSQGMVLLDDSLMALYKEGTISAEQAHSRANEKELFQSFLSKGEAN